MNSQMQRRSSVALLKSTPQLKNLIILNGVKTMKEELKEIAECNNDYISYYNYFL